MQMTCSRHLIHHFLYLLLCLRNIKNMSLKPKDAFHERIITHEVICFLRSDVKLFGKQICRSYVRDKLERCCLRTTLLLSSTYLESEMTSPKN